MLPQYQANVYTTWPRLAQELWAWGMASRAQQAAAIATCAIEAANRWTPIHEFGTPADWARYAGGAAFAGRGLIQITHIWNYQAAGDALGLDLVSNPDLALDLEVACQIFAWYWATHNTDDYADTRDWYSTRASVVGWVAKPPGLDRLVQIVGALLG